MSPAPSTRRSQRRSSAHRSRGTASVPAQRQTVTVSLLNTLKLSGYYMHHLLQQQITLFKFTRRMHLYVLYYSQNKQYKELTSWDT
jgi:hypothetical protein